MGKSGKKVVWVRFGVPRRRGFTLVEVLVVLAILVLLFGLLFAPMMSSMDMATRGRAQVRMQDAARLAMERIHRELSEAMIVYPTPMISAGGKHIADTSQVVFVPPARDSEGRIIQPLRPRKNGSGQILSTRFCVMTARNDGINSLGQHDIDNPFVLWRQEGTYLPDATSGEWVFTPTPGTTGNALTPKEKCDIIPTATICLDDGTIWPGYYDEEADPSGSHTDHTFKYLFQGLQFQPERVAGEYLTPNEDGYQYTARHGAWLGQTAVGADGINCLLTDKALVESALDPRIMIYRNGQDAPILDSYVATTPNARIMPLSWDPIAGMVRVGQLETRTIEVSSLTDPGMGFWPVTTSQADVVPIRPPAPTMAGDVRMPVTYRLYPEGAGATKHAKIVPSSVRVWVTATYGNGVVRSTEYTATTNTNQGELGAGQFALLMDANNRSGEVRFARYEPPSPDQYLGAGTLSSFVITIQFYSRTNFDDVTNYDDTIRVDYWTRDIMNVTLQLSQYEDLEGDSAHPEVLTLPVTKHPAQILMRDQINVRNTGK